MKDSERGPGDGSGTDGSGGEKREGDAAGSEEPGAKGSGGNGPGAAGTADLVCSRVLDAPVERAWQAWSDSGRLRRWWAPAGFTCSVAEVDLREGGRTLVGMSSPEHGELCNTWTFDRVEPPERIEYRQHFADRNGERIDPAAMGLPAELDGMRHSVTLQALGGGRTRVTVTERGWRAGAMRDKSRLGLEQCLENMAGLFRR